MPARSEKKEKLWRPSNLPRTSSKPQTESCGKYSTFGVDAPVIDFYAEGYTTEFAPLNQILQDGADHIMNTACDKISSEMVGVYKSQASPYRGRHVMRWIHIPANNMEWVESVIKGVRRSKNKKKRAKEEEQTKAAARRKNAGKPTEGQKQPIEDEQDLLMLRPDYWVEQQRGCVEHSANHPLYARHMVPFFAEIPPDLASATKSKTTKTKREPNSEKANMVLFMPYLHWATSGTGLEERNKLIKELASEFKKPGYSRPSCEEVDRMEIPVKRKLMRAFLYPEQDRCLHVRRTLDQFYYSTLCAADHRTVDQVVYKFAMKQHNKRERDKKVIPLEDAPSPASPDRSDDEDKDNDVPWSPPKVMMVNQLWMWVIDGDTVVTSFPAKLKSELDKKREAKKREAKEREAKAARQQSTGKEVEGDANSTTSTDSDDYVRGDDLYDSTDIWRAVYRELRTNTEYGKRTQKSALDLAWTIADQALGVFHKRSLHPHLQFIDMFEMEINEITFKQAEAFKAFENNIKAAHNINQLEGLLSTLTSFQKDNFLAINSDSWKEDFRQFHVEFVGKLNGIVIDTGSMPGTSRTNSSQSSNTYVEVDTWSVEVKDAFKAFEKSCKETIRTSLSKLDKEFKFHLQALFSRLGYIVDGLHTTESMNVALDDLIQQSLASLERYTDMIMDDLFDITIETNLVKEIKDISDELNIINSVGRQQDAVIKPFTRHMFPQVSKPGQRDFYDNTRLGNHVGELRDSAKATYSALRHLLDLKQKQTSVIEARSARKAVKASSDQAEASTFLAYESVRQGWSIMLFTIVTIIFLPLSFFTSLFGMNAKELTQEEDDKKLSIRFLSAIMYPVSFAIICISLCLAFNTKFRYLILLILHKLFKFIRLSILGRKRFRFGKTADSIVESIEKERKRRATSYGYKKWKVGV